MVSSGSPSSPGSSGSPGYTPVLLVPSPGYSGSPGSTNFPCMVLQIPLIHVVHPVTFLLVPLIPPLALVLLVLLIPTVSLVPLISLVPPVLLVPSCSFSCPSPPGTSRSNNCSLLILYWFLSLLHSPLSLVLPVNPVSLVPPHLHWSPVLLVPTVLYWFLQFY